MLMRLLLPKSMFLRETWKLTSTFDKRTKFVLKNKNTKWPDN